MTVDHLFHWHFCSNMSIDQCKAVEWIEIDVDLLCSQLANQMQGQNLAQTNYYTCYQPHEQLFFTRWQFFTWLQFLDSQVQTTLRENLTTKLKSSNQHSCLSWVRYLALNRLWRAQPRSFVFRFGWIYILAPLGVLWFDFEDGQSF